MKIDYLVPLFIFSTFASVIFMGILITTFWTAVAIISFIGYFAFSTFRVKQGIKIQKKRKRGISTLLSFFIVLPILLGVVLHYEGYSVSKLFLQLIILYNYTIFVIINTILLPLFFITTIKNLPSSYFEKNYTPKLTVVIPAFNEEKIIKQTVQSVIDADYPKKEIIVVNNNSTDNTKKILEKYQNKILVLDEPRKGKVNAINRGIQCAKGDIIVILDADTRVLHNTLAKIVIPFVNYKIGAVTGNVKVDNRSNLIEKIQVPDYNVSMNLARGVLSLYGTMPIISGAFGAFRKSAIVEKNVSIFTDDTMTEDFDVTVKLLKKGYITSYEKDAIAYTEVPKKIMDLVNQRYRWLRGFIQVYFKHKDYFLGAAFDYSYNIAFFLLMNNNMIVPIIIIINLIAIVPTILIGNTDLVIFLISLGLFNITMFSLLTLRLSGEKISYGMYAPVLMVLFLWITSYIFLKSVIDQILHKEKAWKKIPRIGTT